MPAMGTHNKTAYDLVITLVFCIFPASNYTLIRLLERRDMNSKKLSSLFSTRVQITLTLDEFPTKYSTKTEMCAYSGFFSATLRRNLKQYVRHLTLFLQYLITFRRKQYFFG